MTERKKHSLNVATFIYNATKDAEFRDTYLADPDKLGEEYEMTDTDLNSIKSLDRAKIGSQIESFGRLNLISDKIGMAASHTKDSHTSHAKDAHSNSSHSNGADSLVEGRLDLLVNRLREMDMTISPITTPIIERRLTGRK